MMLVELNAYTSLWNKYRPVILKMMSSAVNEPQQYKFFSHEFKAVGERVKGGYSFSLEVANGKAVIASKDLPLHATCYKSYNNRKLPCSSPAKPPMSSALTSTSFCM